MRIEILRKLKKLSPELRAEKSREITEKVILLPEWKEAHVVLAFLPMPEEVDTTGLIGEALESGKTVGIPRMGRGNGMEFHAIPSLEGPWENHPYGVREPASHLPVIDPSVAGGKTLVLTPGLAFDRRCNRLGRGKGFYDVYLSRFSGYLIPIGLAFALQIVDEVPLDPNDVPLRGIVTQKEILRGGY